MRQRFARSILAVLPLSLTLLALASPWRLGAQAQPQSAPVNDFAGRSIFDITFEPKAQPYATGDLNALLLLHRGDTYDAAKIRGSIEALYATGRYQDIQVDASPAENGVALRFITKNNWFIGRVIVVNEIGAPPSSGQIVNAARLGAGQLYDPQQLTAAVANIRKLLVDNGYFAPVITPALSYDDEHEAVDISFTIRPGRRAHYETPIISGNTVVLDTKAIEKASGWHRFLMPGYRGITQTRTRGGIDRIRLKYQNVHRLEATVILSGITEENDGKLGRPTVVVDPGPTVNVSVKGAKISKGKLRENVPVYEEHSVDADLISEGAGNLRDYFQAQGYFDVTVDYERDSSQAGTNEIVYKVDTGSKHRFVYLGISGNKFFDAKTIRERMFLAPKSFEFRNGRYSEAFARRDRQTIEDLYQSNGFRDVKVESKSIDDYQGKKGDIGVELTIVEGAQYLVSSLNVRGASKLNLTKTLQSISSQAGQIFSEFNVAADRETIIGVYGDNGFSSATFTWTSKPGPRPHTVDLEFVIDEGDQEFVREVVTTGLRTTRPGLVRRQIELNPGSPLSPSGMANMQRKLYDLGIFAQVDMAIQNPDGAEKNKYLLYNLEEASRYSVTTGFGIEFARIGGSNAVTDLSNPGGAPGISPRVSLDVSRLNLFGAAQSLSFSARLSTLQKKGVLTYFVPRIFNLPNFDGTFSVLYDDTHDVKTFQSKREEASTQIAQHLSRPVTIFYRFTYRHVGVSNLKINPLLLPQLAQSVRVGLATVSLVQDRRDDPTDAHKGIYNTIDLGLASNVLGSQTNFVRLLARNATYHKLGSKIVFARETQFGITPAFHIPASEDPTDPVPLAERFFGGGGNSLRGFPDNQAGPRDPITGFPLGGSALFFNNTELRFPLYGSNMNGVLFEDAGNVFASPGAITFRASQRSPADFDYMSHAAGFGLRYRTPLGPLRLDLAYSINPPKYNGFSGSYSQLVQCSVANTCQASLQQISHFQFFFSIGQAF